MLSRRLPGRFVCLRCQLSLTSRGRTRPSPLRSFESSISIRDAPSRSYSDVPGKPTWQGRLPVEDEQQQESVWKGRLPDEDSQDKKDPWQGLFPDEQPRNSDAPARTGHRKPAWREPKERVLHDEAEDTQNAHEQGEEMQEKAVYRNIRVFSRGPAARRPPSAHRVVLDNKPQFYTAKGHVLKPTNRDLPIDILGKAGHVLVMRDAGPRRKKNLQQMAPDAPSDTDLPMNLAKIYESTQLDVPSSAEVLHNIHELQPTENVVPRPEFEAIKQTLYKGFTKAQLATYITKSSLVTKDKDTVQPRPWVLEKWPWAPELEGDGAADALLHGYVTKSTTPKEKLVVGLMRQCWGLGIQELQSQQGYLDVRVQDLHFDLLMLGNRRWLESISKSLFEPGTQIELIRSERIVRIIGPKATAELILQEINTLLDQAHTRPLDATHISPTRLDQSVLDEVGQITHTVVRYDKSGKNIQVSWILSPENQREGLEDLADVAYRLLYSAHGYKQPGDTTMEVQPEPYEVGGWYLLDYHSKPKMAWKDRLAKWARWAMATPRRGAKQADPFTVLQNNLLLRNLDSSPSLSVTPDGWSAEPQVATKAVFGHLLHREPPRPDLEDAFDSPSLEDKPEHVRDLHYNRNIDIHDKLNWHLDRSLSPTIPPLKSLAALTAKSPTTTTTQTSIILRFLPAPDNPTLPSLELNLLTDPDSNTLTPHSLRATTHISTHDILLPSHAVDIRLTDTTSFFLAGSSLSTSCPELATFLSSSDLRPQEGILSTPSRPPPLTLPSRLLPSSTGPTAPAAYIFAGLELHRHVSTSLHGWKLSYTSVEAGQGGGRRAELALEGVRMDSVDTDESGMPLSEFDKFERTLDGRQDGKGAAKMAEGKKGVEGYIETLSGLALGGELSWFGDMPRDRVSRDGEGLDSTGRGRGHEE